ncbi:YoaP domain-containing protein [Brachyspira pilosicoli]
MFFTLDKAKNLPCIFNNWAVFYNGESIIGLFFIMENLKQLIF